MLYSRLQIGPRTNILGLWLEPIRRVRRPPRIYPKGPEWDFAVEACDSFFKLSDAQVKDNCWVTKPWNFDRRLVVAVVARGTLMVCLILPGEENKEFPKVSKMVSVISASPKYFSFWITDDDKYRIKMRLYRAIKFLIS